MSIKTVEIVWKVGYDDAVYKKWTNKKKDLFKQLILDAINNVQPTMSAGIWIGNTWNVKRHFHEHRNRLENSGTHLDIFEGNDLDQDNFALALEELYQNKLLVLKRCVDGFAGSDLSPMWVICQGLESYKRSFSSSSEIYGPDEEKMLEQFAIKFRVLGIDVGKRHVNLGFHLSLEQLERLFNFIEGIDKDGKTE